MVPLVLSMFLPWLHGEGDVNMGPPGEEARFSLAFDESVWQFRGEGPNGTHSWYESSINDLKGVNAIRAGGILFTVGVAGILAGSLMSWFMRARIGEWVVLSSSLVAFAGGMTFLAGAVDFNHIYDVALFGNLKTTPKVGVILAAGGVLVAALGSVRGLLAPEPIRKKSVEKHPIMFQ